MAGQSRKWMLLVATIWIQAFTGTNFDFSEYSSALKSALNISQVQLNYLATASDLGKVFGWSSGLALMYFPLSVVMFMAAFMGFFGYGLQWLVLRNFISLPYCLEVLFISITFNPRSNIFRGPNRKRITQKLQVPCTLQCNDCQKAMTFLFSSRIL